MLKNEESLGMHFKIEHCLIVALFLARGHIVSVPYTKAWKHDTKLSDKELSSGAQAFYAHILENVLETCNDFLNAELVANLKRKILKGN